MTKINIMQTVIEIILALLVILCFIKQDRLISFEDRIYKRFMNWQRGTRKKIIAWGDRRFGKPELEQKTKSILR